jgi:hypothetical protein
MTAAVIPIPIPWQRRRWMAPKLPPMDEGWGRVILWAGCFGISLAGHVAVFVTIENAINGFAAVYRLVS